MTANTIGGLFRLNPAESSLPSIFPFLGFHPFRLVYTVPVMFTLYLPEVRRDECRLR
jgi:hypothetical protein